MITLHPDNFEAETKEGSVVVKFAVANGCRPCDDFKPIYEQADGNLPVKFCEYVRESLPTKEADLDEIEKKYKIQSFPTVLLFENGENKGPVQKYKFYSDRLLAGMILDEQKKLYNQQCYVEDLSIEMQNRKPAEKPPLGEVIEPNEPKVGKKK